MVRQWHRDRGYTDVGYHYIIDATGLIHLGRPVWQVGAHDAGENTGSVGVCLLGDFRDGHDGTPGAAQWRAAVVLCADLLDHFDLPTTALHGHRENEPATTPTECPGFPPQTLRDIVQQERKRRRDVAHGLYLSRKV